LGIKLKNNKKGDYTKLNRKIYFQLTMTVTASAVIVFLIRSLAYQKAGNWIVRFFQNAFDLDYHAAMGMYQWVVRNNLEYLAIIAAVSLIFIFTRFLIARFSGWFDEIDSGIDALMENDGKEINLSGEMAFMERKLNTLKDTLEKRERGAEAAEQRKNDLVTYLAHDIRTPLTSVIGYLSLLDEAPDMPAEQRAKYTHIGLEKAYRLERLIDELFEITRYNLQTITLSEKNIDLSYMLVQLADELYPALSASGKKTVIRADENLYLYGDPDKLSRAFNNILKNAVAYGENDSVIEITAARENDNVVIKFKNDGVIPENQLLTIFDKFYRLDAARSSDTGGAGLGLSIAKEIIAAHNGDLRAESDKGQTVFTITLLNRSC
jgi:two-component system sensor histidine kinase VanS